MSFKLKPIPTPNYGLSNMGKILKGININKFYPVLREKGYLELNEGGTNTIAKEYAHTHFFLNKKSTYVHAASGFDFEKPQIFATQEGLELLKRDYLNGDFVMKKNSTIQPFTNQQ